MSLGIHSPDSSAPSALSLLGFPSSGSAHWTRRSLAESKTLLGHAQQHQAEGLIGAQFEDTRPLLDVPAVKATPSIPKSVDLKPGKNEIACQEREQRVQSMPVPVEGVLDRPAGCALPNLIFASFKDLLRVQGVGIQSRFPARTSHATGWA